MTNKLYQTRSEENGIENHTSVDKALKRGEEDGTIWKISFEAANGDRIRLVRSKDVWYLSLLKNEIKDMLIGMGHKDIADKLF